MIVGMEGHEEGSDGVGRGQKEKKTGIKVRHTPTAMNSVNPIDPK